MSRFLESIKILNCQPLNLEWHQSRVALTFQKFYPNQEAHNLVDLIKPQDLAVDQIYKCRFIYDSQNIQIEFIPYQRAAIKAFKFVEIEDFNYQYKFADRNFFIEIKKKHPEVDELILLKSGMITDTTYANLVFKNDSGLFTPSTPLLTGIIREKLIKQGTLKTADIKSDDLQKYHSFYLINALLGEELDRPYLISSVINS